MGKISTWKIHPIKNEIILTLIKYKGEMLDNELLRNLQKVYNDVTRTYPEIEDRNERYKALLSSLLNTFINPQGAMTSTQRPHITDFEGVVAISSNSTPAPTVSPINENYKNEINTIKDNLNEIEGSEIIEIKEFNGLGELSGIFEELINEEPYKIN